MTDEEICLAVIKKINNHPEKYNILYKYMYALDDVLKENNISIDEERRIQLGWMIYNVITGDNKQ